MRKLLIATAIVSVIATGANAETTRNEHEKLAKAAEPSDSGNDYGRFERSNQPASANPHVMPYQPTDGQVNYNDRDIHGYQDPYATNARAYKSNEFGDAAPAPKTNVFSEYTEPTYHDPRYNRDHRIMTDEYVEPIKRNRK